MRTRRSTSLGDALQGLLEDLGIATRIREYDVVDVWADVVGPHIAGVTAVKSIRNGMLLVSVAQPAWRQELLLRKKELISAINERLKRNVVRDITLI